MVCGLNSDKEETCLLVPVNTQQSNMHEIISDVMIDRAIILDWTHSAP